MCLCLCLLLPALSPPLLVVLCSFATSDTSEAKTLQGVLKHWPDDEPVPELFVWTPQAKTSVVKVCVKSQLQPEEITKGDRRFIPDLPADAEATVVRLAVGSKRDCGRGTTFDRGVELPTGSNGDKTRVRHRTSWATRALYTAFKHTLVCSSTDRSSMGRR